MEKRPNFIVIHADQLRADCVGINGQRSGVYTPYIDSIAWQGANFTSCYTTCPICIPQRLSLLTGQDSKTHGLFSNTGIPYLPLETTLPQEMRKGGYQTALVGRTMHTYPFDLNYGFEYYLPGDPSNENPANDAFMRYVNDHSRADEGGYNGNGSHNNSRAAEPFHLPDDCHQTKWAVNRALDFLRNRDVARPYMLFVGFYAPHSPHNPPADYFNRLYQREDLGSPAIADWDIPPVSSGNVMARYNKLSEEDVRCMYAGYLGNIAFMDAQVGRLLQAVMRDRNTYVIFTSDHGEMLGDHHLMQKNRPYQGAVHIPFMIMGPGIADGQTMQAPIGWHDIMPTILELAGLQIPYSVDGRSMVPILKGEQNPPVREYIHGECCHEFLFNAKARPVSEKYNYMYELGSQFLTDGTMKYIWYVTSGREQLFNIAADPGEMQDLSERPEYAEELALWRGRMVQELADREEGFSDGRQLIPGRTPTPTSAKLAELVRQRQTEGFRMAYAQKPMQTPMDRLEYQDHFMTV